MHVKPVLILGAQGYIGSALASYLRSAGVPFGAVDLGLRGTPLPVPTRVQPYQDLTTEDLAEYGSVVLLAGHSSVGACDRAPEDAFANNVAGFVGLVHKLRGQKLIFASTISVYVKTNGRLAAEDDPLPEAVSFYDLHKQMIERYAGVAYPESWYALRFGTVCGPGPNIRAELLLNSLVAAACRAGRVEVANRDVRRPLLGVNDLCRAVHFLLTERAPPGCYNLASANVRIGEAADYVARRCGVDCREVERENRYDICVDTSKFCRVSGLRFEDTVPVLVESLREFFSCHP